MNECGDARCLCHVNLLEAVLKAILRKFLPSAVIKPPLTTSLLDNRAGWAKLPQFRGNIRSLLNRRETAFGNSGGLSMKSGVTIGKSGVAATAGGSRPKAFACCMHIKIGPRCVAAFCSAGTILCEAMLRN